MKCPACRDEIETGRKVNGRLYCIECGNELADGIIGPPPRPLFFGGIDREQHVEAGPWQENAVRHLEEA